VLLLEGRERLGGRTWSSEWAGTSIELGGRGCTGISPTPLGADPAGLAVQLGRDAERAAWYVGDERRVGTIAERDEIARRGGICSWTGQHGAAPAARSASCLDRLVRFDRLTIAERIAELELGEDEREVLSAELESLAHRRCTTPARSQCCAGTLCR